MGSGRQDIKTGPSTDASIQVAIVFENSKEEFYAQFYAREDSDGIRFKKGCDGLRKLRI
jgi:hypothetical protein